MEPNRFALDSNAAHSTNHLEVKTASWDCDRAMRVICGDDVDEVTEKKSASGSPLAWRNNVYENKSRARVLEKTKLASVFCMGTEMVEGLGNDIGRPGVEMVTRLLRKSPMSPLDLVSMTRTSPSTDTHFMLSLPLPTVTLRSIDPTSLDCENKDCRSVCGMAPGG